MQQFRAEEVWRIADLSCAIMEEQAYCRVYRNDGAIGTIDEDTLERIIQLRSRKLLRAIKG
jgi:hypothetical protein